MTRVMSKGYNDSVTLEERTKTLEQLSRQRWQDAERFLADAAAAAELADDDGARLGVMAGSSALRHAEYIRSMASCWPVVSPDA